MVTCDNNPEHDTTEPNKAKRKESEQLRQIASSLLRLFEIVDNCFHFGCRKRAAAIRVVLLHALLNRAQHAIAIRVVTDGSEEIGDGG